jgi:hypothetical protein
VTVIGLVFIAALGLGLISGRNGYNYVLAATIGFNDSSIVQAGSVAVSPFYAGAIIWIIANSTIWRRPRERHGQGLAILFVVFTALVTAVGPTVFRGMGVVASDIGLDQQAGRLTPLEYSTSNAAQLIYLAVVVTILAMNTSDGIRERHVMTGLVVGSLTALSSMVIPSWPHQFFDNRGDGFYSIETIRVRGQFAEPSHLGAFALVCCIFFVTRLVGARTLRQGLVSGAWAAVSALLLSVSATGTALIGLPIAVVVAGTLLIARWVRSGKHLNPLVVMVVAFSPVVVAAVAFRYWTDVVDAIVQKTGSSSYSTRTFVDANALHVLVDSWFLGVGAGSNRGSSLLLMILSQVGVIGTLLFLLLMWRAVRKGYAHSTSVAAASGLVAFLCAAFVSLADLVSPIMWLLVIVCMASTSRAAGPERADAASANHLINEVSNAYRPRH